MAAYNDHRAIIQFRNRERQNHMKSRPPNSIILKCFSTITCEPDFFWDVRISEMMRTFLNFTGCILEMSKCYENNVTKVIPSTCLHPTYLEYFSGTIFFRSLVPPPSSSGSCLRLDGVFGASRILGVTARPVGPEEGVHGPQGT